MALKITPKKGIALNALLIISKSDDSIADEGSDWDAYAETFDENKLVFVPDHQPTRFLVNFQMQSKDIAKVKNHMLGKTGEDGRPTFAYGEWSQEIVRRTLKEIQQPDSLTPEEKIPFKKDKDGFVHPDTLAVLERLGIIEEIFGYYAKHVLTSTRAEAKN